MRSDSADKKKKPYSAPTFAMRTREQAITLVANRTHRSLQEAAAFLASLGPGLNHLLPKTKDSRSSA